MRESAPAAARRRVGAGRPIAHECIAEGEALGDHAADAADGLGGAWLGREVSGGVGGGVVGAGDAVAGGRLGAHSR